METKIIGSHGTSRNSKPTGEMALSLQVEVRNFSPRRPPMRSGRFDTPRGASLLALLWIAALWWLFVWRYLTPVPADRLMLALGDFTHTFYVFRDLAYRALRVW
jgi:hypothetical protein